MSTYVYPAYYRRTIEQFTQGLKLVLGGTGLGKTSSLAELLQEGSCPADVKFIYVANRIQLLDEMAAQLPDKTQYVQQHKDAEQLRQALADGSLDALLADANTPALLAEYKRRGRLPALALADLRSRADKFRQASALGKAAKGLVNLGDLASDTLRPLKELLSLARQLGAESPAAGQAIDQAAAQALASQPVWPRLFPYLTFQAEDNCRLLLLTVHKAFHGVFDGRRTVRLGSWEAQKGWRYVFVFDEFDFLENDLLGLLAADREVRDPFGLVATFYERLCRRKLSHRQYLARPEWQWVREAFDAIRTRIESLKKDHEIDFPETTHFVTAEKNIRGRAIFQSNYSLVTQPVYLDPTDPRDYSFTLTQASGKNVFTLFEVVTRVVKDIIRLFNRLQVEHEDIYFEVLRQCFDDTAYLEEIRQINQIGAQHELCETNYGNLLANGFGLYEIETDKSPLSDPEEVALLYLSLNDSPEAMLRALARRHLVFGLSATAHIERVLRNFDFTGLAHATHPADSFGPLPSTPADLADVQRANEAKARKRNNTITYEVVPPLLPTTAFGEQLVALAQAAPGPEPFGTGAAQGYRVQRAQHFFGLLARLATLGPAELATDQTHLVFLYSLRQVKYLLETGGDEDQWFGATPRHLDKVVSGLQIYDVWCCDETKRRRVSCAVVLYDAQFGQDLRNDLDLHQEYNALFWDERPVVVVTTYASAGNGVNLQYFRTRADYESEDKDQQAAGKRDFCHLHLLEAPYYYFSGVGKLPTAAERQAAIKRDVYGILKLLYAKRLSQAQALAELGHIRRLNLFNGPYLQTPDGMLNQFSVFVQALGRIERVWQPMPAQKLWLDRQVYGVFEQLATSPALAQERENYLQFASQNMRDLLAAIAREAPRQRQALEDDLDDLHARNEAVRAAIHEMVLDIEQFKRSGGTPGEVRKRWQWLREDVLRHDMARPLPADEALPEKPRPNQLQRLRGTFRSHYAQAGRLLISRDLELAPPTALSPDFMPWDLNAVYRPFTNVPNSYIAAHFRVRGYELAFVESGTYLLPYVYQSILIGAVGEEAITAVLRHADISVSGGAVPDEVFEVADLKLDRHPVYIDCKNFGVRTLRHFALTPDDLLYHPKLNEAGFKKQLVKKWAILNQVPRPAAAGPCRLVVMNLFDDEESALRFYDEHFEPVAEWAQARLVVLTGTLNPQATSIDDLLTPACTRLLTSFKRL